MTSKSQETGTSNPIDTDFSRLEELFYKSRTSQEKKKEISLKGFITFALSHYGERYYSINDGNIRFKKYTFKPNTGEEAFELTVYAISQVPSVNQISMSGNTNSLTKLLKNLDGETEIRFKTAKLSDLGIKMRGELGCKPDGSSYLQAGRIGLNLRLNSEDIYIEKASLQQTHSKLLTGKTYFEPLELSAVIRGGLSRLEKRVLRRASTIHVNQDLYEGNNKKKELTRIECIIQKNNKRYLWTYQTRSANAYGNINSECLSQLNKLFNMIKNAFTPEVFFNIKVSDVAYVGEGRTI